MSCLKLATGWVLQRAALLFLVVALAAAQLSCTSNSVYVDGRVTECFPLSNNCQYGVCWGEQLNNHR